MKSAAVLTFLTLASAAPAVRKREAPAPLIKLQGQQAIAGKYIVKMKEGTSAEALERVLKAFPETQKYVYKNTRFTGFASELADSSLKLLQDEFDVDYIEEDGIVKISDVEMLQAKAYTTQSDAVWGLARISHRSKGVSGYTYDTTAGANTCAYIIDTGIYTGHSDFGGRATFLANYAGDGSNTDGNGHGTHVAGTIGSTTYGVAKKTKLFAVKVLGADGSGTNSGVIAGMNFVTKDAPTRSGCSAGVVANMSLGGSRSSAVNSAAADMVRAGIFLAVAAGNENQDATNSSPASESSACTVGATTSADARSSFSNYGTIVDVFAPGSSIKSTWIGSTTATNTISGTSMASPHIAGLGAYFLGLGASTASNMCSYIQSVSTKNVITGLPSGTKNYLAFNGNPSGKRLS